MTRRAAILLSLTAFVGVSSGLGLYFATPPLERIPTPRTFAPVNRIEVSHLDRVSHTIAFLEPGDRTIVCPFPTGHEDDLTLGGIYSADQQSILVLFRHELHHSQVRATWEVLLNRKWATARWEFWQFPLGPNRTPRIVATWDTDLPNNATYYPGLWLTAEGPVVSLVAAAKPESEDTVFYRLRL